MVLSRFSARHGFIALIKDKLEILRQNTLASQDATIDRMRHIQIYLEGFTNLYFSC